MRGFLSQSESSDCLAPVQLFKSLSGSKTLICCSSVETETSSSLVHSAWVGHQLSQWREEKNLQKLGFWFLLSSRMGTSSHLEEEDDGGEAFIIPALAAEHFIPQA